jgi:quinolinate synthase
MDKEYLAKQQVFISEFFKLRNKQQKLIEEIEKLKKKKKAVILVHNYQLPEIYKIADFIGDSLELSRAATKTKAKIIVFCGVDFMAESAKILNPDKIVLLPVLEAKCPMAGQVKIEELKELQKKHPEAATVCYINTSAETKAISDICCTSANVIEVVNSLPNKKIIFVPDKNLAKYVSRYTNKEIISWPGFCYVHHQFLAQKVREAKNAFPKAEVLAHPECPSEVLDLADYVCSTSQMLKRAKESKAKEFIILTEMGMLERLKMEIPDKKFYTPQAKICIQQKKNRLESVYNSLLFEKYKIAVPEVVRIKAKRALDKMLQVSYAR